MGYGGIREACGGITGRICWKYGLDVVESRFSPLMKGAATRAVAAVCSEASIVNKSKELTQRPMSVEMGRAIRRPVTLQRRKGGGRGACIVALHSSREGWAVC